MTMKKSLFLLLMSLALYGCVKGPAMPAPYVEVNQDYIVVPNFNISYEISVESNTQWKLTVPDAWVSASLTSAAGDASVVFTMQDNPGEARIAHIQLTDIRSLVNKEIRILQNGKNGADYIPVSTIRSRESASGYTFTSGRLKAFVLSNYSAANYPEGQMAVGDSFTSASSGIRVISADGYVAFEQGSEVDINLTGATLARKDGILTLTLRSRPEQTLTSVVQLVPKVVTYSEFASGDYESMYVCANNFQVLEEYIGGTFVRSPLLENETDQHIRLSVREKASFSADTYNKGKGNICGLAGLVNGGVPTLEPTTAKDAAFTRLRFGAPGIEELPYVFSFLTYQDMDDCPKYLIYHELHYNETTKLVKGMVAEDEDESVAATLELTAYGEDASKINGQKTHYWSEYAGHDNVMCTGFVSLNCKTTPTEECGWWWSVPLKMDLPAKINVSFGLAGTDYALCEWLLSWSKDKRNWHPAEESVFIDQSRTDGTYYLYFTVPLNLTESFTTGDTFYVKLIPQGQRGCKGSMGLDGHGSSCQVNLHSALVISEEVEQRTKVPAGAVYFQPFDKLTAGMDYFYGEKLAAMLNYDGGEYSEWSTPKKALLDLDTRDVYERPGYAQIGFVNEERAGTRTEYKNYPGTLILPAIGEQGDFTLTFKAARYRNACVDRPGNRVAVPDIVHPDISKGVVRLLPEDTTAYFEETKSSTAQFSGMPYDKFKVYNLTIKGATIDTKVAFTSVAATTDEFTRWFIDDITLIKAE